MPTTVIDAQDAAVNTITVAMAVIPNSLMKFFIIHSLFRDLYKKAGISADAPTRRFSVKEEKKVDIEGNYAIG
jgi:hypothetical protein